MMPVPLFSTDPGLEAELRRILAPVPAHLVPPTQDLCANYDPATGDCTLHLDLGSGPMVTLNDRLSTIALIGATRLLATEAGKSLNPRAPELNCVLASGFRWHSVLSPAGDGPSLAVRTHHRRDWRFADYDIADEQLALIRAAIEQRWTILISGVTGSGKTSFASAIIALFSAVRILVIEDEPELQIETTGRNIVRRRATAAMDFSAHVRAALRDRPDYIILGEMRGEEAADVLEAAASGHPGLSTIHAGSCTAALQRLQRLAQRDAALVREAIDLVIQLRRESTGRRAVVQTLALKEMHEN